MTDTEHHEKVTRTLDCVGLYCPQPLLQTREIINTMALGEILEVIADDPAAEEDLKRFAKRTGYEILSFQKENNILHFLIKKSN